MFAKAEQFVAEAEPRAPAVQREPLPPDRRKDKQKEEEQGQGSSDDDMPGPALPGEPLAANISGRSTKSGPAIPTLQDLELKRGKAAPPPSLPLLYPLQHLTLPCRTRRRKHHHATRPPPHPPPPRPPYPNRASRRTGASRRSRLQRPPAGEEARESGLEPGFRVREDGGRGRGGGRGGGSAGGR